jgi:hypothetical protein
MLYCQIDVYFDDIFKILTSFFIFYLIIFRIKLFTHDEKNSDCVCDFLNIIIIYGDFIL